MSSKIKYNCPKCGHPLEHIRFLNEEVFGTGKKNPFIGWVCRNEKCHGWYCDYCEEWHPYGTMCGVAAVRNSRDRFNQYAICDPNWKHREKDLK